MVGDVLMAAIEFVACLVAARMALFACEMKFAVVESRCRSHASFWGDSSCRYCCRWRLFAFFLVGLGEPELNRVVLCLTLVWLTLSPPRQVVLVSLMLRSAATIGMTDLSLFATMVALVGLMIASWRNPQFAGHWPKTTVLQHTPLAMPRVSWSHLISVLAFLRSAVSAKRRRSAGG